MLKKNYKIIFFVSLFFVLIFVAQEVSAQSVNYCLNGTPSFAYTYSNPPCASCCVRCRLGNNWYTNPLSINDNNSSTFVGACTARTAGRGIFHGTYTATVKFDSVKPQVDRVEYLTLGAAYGQSGTITTSLYYEGSWHNIHTRTVNTYTWNDNSGKWIPSGYPNPITVTIVSGGPWHNVEQVRVYVDAWSALNYCISTYVFEVRAWGSAGPSYQDIGLRVKTPSGIVSIAAEMNAADSPLRIAKNGTIYGVALVALGDPNDSGVRIRLGSGQIKALRKL